MEKLERRSDQPISIAKLILVSLLYTHDCDEAKAKLLFKRMAAKDTMEKKKEESENGDHETKDEQVIKEDDEMLGKIFVFLCRMTCYRMPTLFLRNEGYKKSL